MPNRDIVWENRAKTFLDQLETDRTRAEKRGKGRKHLVSIVHQNGCCKVDPPVLHASPGDKILWKFDGSTDGGYLFFPVKELFNGHVHKIPKEGVEQPMGKVERGRYPYAIYCKTHNCFAVGNSDPRIDYP